MGTIIMKFLLLIAAIASVRAEADPAFSYATGYHLPYALGAPLTYTAAAAPVVTPTPLSSTPPLLDARTRPVPWCLVPTVVSFPSESQLLLLLQLLRSPLWRRQGRRGKLRLKPRPIQKPRPMPGISTALTATGPSATATLPTAMLLTHTPVTTATTGLATTTATTAGRRGRRPLRLMLRLLPRLTPGCCMAATVFLMAATTATATTTPPMPTLEAAVTTLVVLSPVPPADKKKRCEKRSK